MAAGLTGALRRALRAPKASRMTGTTPLLRIGTRGSPLALAQANEVRRRLRDAHPELQADSAVEIRVIKTSGDRIQDRKLSEIGGKGLFTKEIEEDLLSGAIDLAVHSMKDVPTWLPDGLEIVAILPREDPRDALFANRGDSLATLPEGAVVGTSSLRRQAQILLARPDLKVVSLRGNVATRLRKLGEGQVDATLLAVAGLRRLGEHERIGVDEMLPAVAQGAIGLEVRSGDARTLDWVSALDDPVSAQRVRAERACLAVLDGSCKTPIAAYAELDGENLTLRGLVAMPDGSAAHRSEESGPAADPGAIGRTLGQRLRDMAGPDFYKALEQV